MRIVNRKEFMALPEYTLYSNYEPCCFGPLSIKYDNSANVDFYTNSLHDSIESDSSEEYSNKLLEAQENKSSVKMDFDQCGRDGMFDEDQLFAVWENEDITRLITELQKCVKDGQKK